tara:strand:- start:1074 stop:1331 length:258 start_codon:yes stop_codon:yes gene_type:complete
MKYLVIAKSLSTSKGIVTEGNYVELPEKEVAKIHFMKPGSFEAVAEAPVFKSSKKAPAKKKRARNSNGTLKADDPSTPDVNEAYE